MRTLDTIAILRRTDRPMINRVIGTLPLTSACTRVVRLMEEDSIHISADSATYFDVHIGDFIIDELFGTFYIADEVMPSLQNGVYHYEFVAVSDFFMLAQNRIFMLVSDDSRKECEWSLTERLSAHVEQVVANINALGRSYTYQIHESADKAQEVRCMTYNGINIYSALKNICDEWQCEWWVADNCIHIGKCESEADELLIEYGITATDIQVQHNSNTYADKIYAFGSKDNIPVTYRKKLIGTINKWNQNDNTYATDIALNQDMFPLSQEFQVPIPRVLNTTGYPQQTTFTIQGEQAKYTGEKRKYYRAKQHISVGGFTAFWGDGLQHTGTITMRATATLYRNGSIVATDTDSAQTTYTNRGEVSINSVSLTFAEDSAYEVTNNAIFHVTISVELTFSNNADRPSRISAITAHNKPQYVTFSVGDATGSAVVRVRSNEYNGYVRFNPRGVHRYTDEQTINPDFYLFATCNESGVVDGAQAWKYGDKVEFDDGGSIKIPSAFYSTEYDSPMALTRIGETRLQLPQVDESGNALNGYLLRSGVAEQDAVEQVVIFNGIYPDGKLKVVAISTEKKTDYTKYEGESETADWQWEEYTLTLQFADGTPFNFDADWILPNQKLQLRFIVPVDTAVSSPGKLTGMTFDAQYNRAQNTFTLVRNNDYGAMLPNSVLCPSVGDTCVLLGWNVRAVDSMGLVADAEQRLLQRTREYLNAIEEGQFTITATLIADSVITHSQLLTAENETFITADNLEFTISEVKMLLPKLGQRANVVLGVTDKHSRIIGIETKLDIPIDTPKLTIGESDAYSRLKRIEKELTKIGN